MYPVNSRTFLVPLALLCAGLATGVQAAQGPSFKCSENMLNSVEGLICKSEDLSSLDRKLAATYGAALKKAGSRANTLKAEQRGWIKGRNECWKADDKEACLRDNYNQRTVELQAGYALVESKGPVIFDCGANGSISATFFQTDPPSINATYKEQHSLMVAVPSGSGMNYKGQNESFWEHQGEAAVTWGYGAKEMICKRKS
ncbi:MAG TPA: MliC family protein [Pseudomonas sp.]|nr:MliC family protein [Pseudomonas sp.]